MPDRRKARTPGLALAWAHLAVMWSFAFAKPLLDVLADSPDFFVARGNTAGDIVLLACVLVLVPPSLFVLAEALLARLPRAREALHLGLVGLLAAARSPWGRTRSDTGDTSRKSARITIGAGLSTVSTARTAGPRR